MAEISHISVLKNPSLEASEVAIKVGLSQKRSLILIGHCWIEYNGRARSILEPGDRVLLIKSDSSVLIHRPTGYKPVNWQPPECYFRTRLTNETLIITAIRRKVQESLIIYFDKLFVLTTMELVDEGQFYLHVSEKEIQEAIIANPDLLEEAFQTISYEKKVEPGFIDVYGLDKEGNLTVVEIKRGRAGKSAVIQLAKYVDSIKMTADRPVRGILAAPQIMKGVQKMLATLHLDYRKIDLKKCAQTITFTKATKIQDFF
jgi:RecB family endonuclease NucS